MTVYSMAHYNTLKYVRAAHATIQQRDAPSRCHAHRTSYIHKYRVCTSLCAHINRMCVYCHRRELPSADTHDEATPHDEYALWRSPVRCAILKARSVVALCTLAILLSSTVTRHERSTSEHGGSSEHARGA